MASGVGRRDEFAANRRSDAVAAKPLGDVAESSARGRHGRRWWLAATCCAGMAAGAAAQGISPGDGGRSLHLLRVAAQDSPPPTQRRAIIVDCAMHF
ncbi:MAG: hypothetical protein IPN24_18050 [Betaproteobacteria bacterium]|nr:hypothetical protein [Betaproteobacteria bacterium]